jgi:hypothetical protein
MKSGRQRREEIKAKRERRSLKRHSPEAKPRSAPRPPGNVPVNESALAPYNSYGAPSFIMHGYYQDVPFHCQGCGKDEIWPATQQKWWYEVAKGYMYSTAKLCRPCRRKEQARRAEARRVHLEGLARKKAARAAKK